MKVVLLTVPFLLAIALVVYTERSFSGFTFWNALPIVLGLGVLLAARRSHLATIVGCATFAIAATLLVVLFHLAWFFDWGGTATSSSTSALAFIFVPFWACIFASIVASLAWVVMRLVRKGHVAQ